MRQVLVSGVVAAVVAAAVVLGLGVGHGGNVTEAKPVESAYERVVRTKTIRCGYVEWPGYVEKDPTTGKMSGVAYDTAEAIGKELGLKVEWAEPVGWGDYQEGLNAGRYDVTCAGLWLTGNRIMASLLTQPLFYSAMYAVVRADDDRFDGDLTQINRPGVRIQTIEGDMTESIHKELFPLATAYAVSPAVDSGVYVLNLINKKADVGFMSTETFEKYNSQNPEKKLKVAYGGKPVRIFANVFAVKKGETDLKAALDGAAESLLRAGSLQAIIKTYHPGVFSELKTYEEVAPR